MNWAERCVYAMRRAGFEELPWKSVPSPRVNSPGAARTFQCFHRSHGSCCKVYAPDYAGTCFPHKQVAVVLRSS